MKISCDSMFFFKILTHKKNDLVLALGILHMEQDNPFKKEMMMCKGHHEGIAFTINICLIIDTLHDLVEVTMTSCISQLFVQT
jgi:acetolactate synthase small subunit